MSLVGKEIVHEIVMFKAMAADQRAMASAELDISSIPEGT